MNRDILLTKQRSEMLPEQIEVDIKGRSNQGSCVDITICFICVLALHFMIACSPDKTSEQVYDLNIGVEGEGSVETELIEGEITGGHYSPAHSGLRES